MIMKSNFDTEKCPSFYMGYFIYTLSPKAGCCLCLTLNKYVLNRYLLSQRNLSSRESSGIYRPQKEGQARGL